MATFGCHLVDLGCRLDADWILKGIQKSHFWNRSEYNEKRWGPGSRIKKTQISIGFQVFDAKSQGPDLVKNEFGR